MYLVTGVQTCALPILLLINAFGMEQTLGNVLFAVTFLITDILSECEGKDRKSVVQGKSVDLGGRRIIKKKKKKEVVEEQ